MPPASPEDIRVGPTVEVQVPGMDDGLEVGDEGEGSLGMLRCELGCMGH